MAWTDQTFTIQIKDGALLKVRPLYQNAVGQARKARKNAEEGAAKPGGFMDWDGLKQEVERIHSELNLQLKNTLTTEQMSKLEAYHKKRKEQNQQRRRWRPACKKLSCGTRKSAWTYRRQY